MGSGVPVGVDQKLWAELMKVARRVTRTLYGAEPTLVGFMLADSAMHWVPVVGSAVDAEPTPTKKDAPPLFWEEGRYPRQAHDFTWVYWPGLGRFTFTGDKQRAIVGVLLSRCLDQGESHVSDAELLEAAEAESKSVPDLFRKHSALGRLIRQGPRPGTRQLPWIPDEVGTIIHPEEPERV